MSVGSIASSLVSGLDSTTDGTFSKMQQAWKDLENSLKSGDLNSANKAYATITQLQQQMTSQFGNPPGGSQFSSDMEALGKALDSGNLSDAQQAFVALKNDMKNHPHPPMQNSDSSSTDSEIVQLLQQLESSSSGSSSSSTKSNSSLGQGISINVKAISLVTLKSHPSLYHWAGVFCLRPAFALSAGTEPQVRAE